MLFNVNVISTLNDKNIHLFSMFFEIYMCYAEKHSCCLSIAYNENLEVIIQPSILLSRTNHSAKLVAHPGPSPNH